MDANVVTESVQQFNLRWTNYTNNLLELLIEQFNKGFLTDVTLFCEGTLIKAHKMVLAACSSYFEHLFTAYNETNPLIVLNGVRLKDLKILIQFMYRGEIKIHEHEVETVLKLAHELQVKGLSELKSDFSSCKNVSNDPSNIQEQNHVDPKTKCFENSSVLQNSFDNQKKPSTRKTSPMPNTVQPKAFVMFAEKMRKKLMNEYPHESPKDISVRLGVLWKTLPLDKKRKYFEMARKDCTELDTHASSKPTIIEDKEVLKRKRNNDDNPQIPETQNIPSSIGDDDDVEFVDSSNESISDDPVLFCVPELQL